MLIRRLVSSLRDHSIRYLSVYIPFLFIVGFWPFNFNERNNASIDPDGGLLLARHGTAYTSSPADKLKNLKQFAIHIDLTTSTDGQDSLAKIFGCLNDQVDQNFFMGQWQDGIELHVRTERNPGGMIYGAGGVLEKYKRAPCLIIYDGQRMHLYANGTLLRRDNRGSLSFSNWSRDYPLVAGTDARGRSQWKGTIYQIALWDRALSPKEISAMDNGRRSVKCNVSSEENNEKKPLVHYVFKPENTYETTLRGKKATGVRDLGRGEPADLVIPGYFEPYARVFLGWDSDWAKSKTNWLDLVVNVLGFIPFGILTYLKLATGKLGIGHAGLSGLSSLSGRKEGKSKGRIAAGRNSPPHPNPFPPGAREMMEAGVGWPRALKRREAAAVVSAVAAGFVVSFAIEWLQAYLPSRDSSLRDLVANTLGTMIGAVAVAWLMQKREAEIVPECSEQS